MSAKKIRTADGFTATEGDLVFDYYEGYWGIIGPIDNADWFDVTDENGRRFHCKGECVCMSIPADNPYYGTPVPQAFFDKLAYGALVRQALGARVDRPANDCDRPEGRLEQADEIQAQLDNDAQTLAHELEEVTTDRNRLAAESQSWREQLDAEILFLRVQRGADFARIRELQATIDDLNRDHQAELKEVEEALELERHLHAEKCVLLEEARTLAEIRQVRLERRGPNGGRRSSLEQRQTVAFGAPPDPHNHYNRLPRIWLPMVDRRTRARRYTRLSGPGDAPFDGRRHNAPDTRPDALDD